MSWWEICYSDKCHGTIIHPAQINKTIPRIFAGHVAEAEVATAAVDQSLDLLVPLLLLLGLGLVLIGQRHHVGVVPVAGALVRRILVAVVQKPVLAA